MVDSRKYWLGDPDVEKVVQKRMENHKSWALWSSNPVSQAWVRNTLAYYSHVLDPNSWDTSLVFQGDQGELVKMLVPQARSIVRQTITLITAQKLSFKALAKSEGRDVMNDVRLADGICNDTVEKQRLDTKGELLLENTLVLGGGFTKTTWDTSLGDPWAASEGVLVHKGGVDISIHSPMDVYYEYKMGDWQKMDWVEVRVKKNKWDLIAQYPELEDELQKVPTVQDFHGINIYNSQQSVKDDYIWCYELYHKPTPAMPVGRMIFYASDKAVFYDGQNEYGCIPVEPCIPEQFSGAFLGVPFFSSLLPMQEMLDICFSAIGTNNANLGVQNVTIPRGAAISVEQIQGMNWISYTPQNIQGGGKPEPLQLVQSAPETFKFIDLLHSHLQQVGNSSPALRGNPPPGVTSGTAFATLSANAIEFMKGTSKAYFACMKNTMEHAINATRKFAKIPQEVAMRGKTSLAQVREYTGKDLDNIHSISITLQNPLMQTMAGRIEISDKLMSSGLITTPQDYFTILEGGDLTNLTDNKTTENDLVMSENELLADGNQVFALWSDNHPYHIHKHKKLLDDPNVRFYSDKIEVIQAHIMEHSQLAQTTDPMLYQMAQTGQMPEMQPQMMNAPPPPQGGEPQTPQAMVSPEDGEGSALAAPADVAPDLLGRGRA
jgi:hypothetical protein